MILKISNKYIDFRVIFLFIFLGSYLFKFNAADIVSYALTVIYLLLFFLSIMCTKKISYKYNVLDSIFFTYSIFVLFSSLYSSDIGVSLSYTLPYFAYVFLPFYLIRFFNYDLGSSLNNICGSAVILLIFFIIVSAAFTPDIFSQARLGGDKLNAVALAYLILPLSCCSLLSFLLFREKKFFRFISLICALVGFYIVLGTGTRGATLSLALSVVSFLIISRRNYFSFKSILIFTSVFCLLYIIALNSFLELNYFDRYDNILSSASVSEREILYSKSMSLFYDNPLFGVGTGSFTSIHKGYPHSLIFENLSSYGVLGSCLLGLFFIYVIFSYRKYNNDSEVLEIVLFFFLLAFFSKLSSFSVANYKDIVCFAAILINIVHSEGRIYS